VTDQARLDFDAPDPLDARDAYARALAVDPARNVALEASAGTGKTRVLVDRYIGLLISGVQPRNILAITFTRKAAAEMRQRILDDLARRSRDGSLPLDVWRLIRANVTDIAISTIDAFCLTLLREFPLEADIDPAFDLADETETPGLVDDALERTLRIGRGLTNESPEIALLFAELGEFRLRQGLARLIDRRLVADDALNRFLRGCGEASIDGAVARLRSRLRAAFAATRGGLEGFIASGPAHRDLALLARDLRQLLGDAELPPGLVQALLERGRDYFLTQAGEPRKRVVHRKDQFRTERDHERHAGAVAALGPYLVDALASYRREVNIVLARAVRRLFTIALKEYRETLRKRGVLDFSEVLDRTLALLAQMDEFSRSRYKLEARYHHVLVDEFQDTSRAQWSLVELLVRSWSAGVGLTDADRTPTIFIVGDRKQSIYGFRDADVAVLDEAASYIEALRPQGQVRAAISHSFRSVRELLLFANDLFAAVEKSPERGDAFRYGNQDLFPVASVGVSEAEPLGVIAASSDEAQAEAVAEEIARLLATGATVRDRDSGVRRAIRPGDVAVLFRTRDSHRAYEEALAQRRVPFYVYKGLGFFDADEIKDVLALLAFLGNPASELRAAAFLRSRFVGLSDEALKCLAPDLSGSLLAPDAPAAVARLDSYDRTRLYLARRDVPRWVGLVDVIAPAELLDQVLSESAYAAVLDPDLYRQARENLKKVRALVRRMQNRGYTTLGRIVEHFSRLVAGGDESNAIVDAIDAVNLMTVHAAKGLEFPVVFVVNLNRGSGGGGDPVRIVSHGTATDGGVSVAIGDYQTDADKDLEARETEEAKRLLYVAVTRARDRLYLGASLGADGRFAPAKGSLGRVLPASFCETLTRAGKAECADVASWMGAGGAHQLRVLRARGTTYEHRGVTEDVFGDGDVFEPMRVDAARRVPATDISSTGADTPTMWRSASASTIEAGLLVHRALQQGIGWGALSPVERRGRLLMLLRPHERVAVADLDALVERALAAYESLIQDLHLRELAPSAPSGPLIFHELPFSLRRADNTIVRGVIDAVVEYPDGRIQVLEFKTGARRGEHAEQLDIYLEAARALFPDSQVDGRVIYAEEQLSVRPGV